MDLSGWMNFLAQSMFLFVLCWVAAAVVTGLALALPAGLPQWAGAVIATLLPVIGPFVLLVLVLIRLIRSRTVDAPHEGSSTLPVPAARPSNDGAGSMFGGAAAGTPFGAASVGSPFGGGAPEQYFGSSAPGSPFGATGAGASPFGGAPSPSSSPFGSGVGIPADDMANTAGNGVASAIEPPRASASRLSTFTGRFGRNRAHPPSLFRLVGLVVLATATVAAAASLLVSWFTFDSQIVPPLSVWAWGTGLDVAVISTVVFLIAAQGLAWWRPSRWAAVIAVTAGAIWTFVAGSVLALAVQVTALLNDIDAFSYDVGDALGSFGLTGDAGVVTLPEGIDLSVIGVPGPTVDLRTIDLAAPIPAATLELGPGWFIAVAVGAVVVLWAVAEVIRANRAVLAATRRSR
ncbi:hypothetical protein HQQ80_11765 [Microbacteriaceae bacterium VKM Ac-2855]|nr:hypothetical protein [Microbacteriaceae bacterium VKM Ac-2855]